jgi:predicted transcriptional regulator
MNAQTTVEQATGNDESIASLTADILSSYLANNTVEAASLPELIADVARAVQRITGNDLSEPGPPQEPAVPIDESVTEDYIVCLEDGKQMKTLKRHLSHFGLTPEQYREKWALPADYPMVAPSYSKKRSKLAKELGLGRKGADAKNKKATAKTTKSKSTKSAPKKSTKKEAATA